MASQSFGLFDLIVYALALWRVSSLLQSENGPFDIFHKFRELVGIHHDDNGDILEIEDRWLPRLMACVWCLSMFLALFYVPLIYFFHEIAFWLSVPFALSAGAIIVERIVR